MWTLHLWIPVAVSATMWTVIFLASVGIFMLSGQTSGGEALMLPMFLGMGFVITTAVVSYFKPEPIGLTERAWWSLRFNSYCLGGVFALMLALYLLALAVTGIQNLMKK